MPCVKRSLLALAAVALLTFFPKATFASTAATCECFCGSAGTGAVDADQMTNSACQQTCIDTNTRFVGCFNDPQQYPDRNPKCWTQDQCESWSGYSGATLIGASWAGGDMPYDCAVTKTSSLPQKYCYADDAPYTLNVAIGSVTEVANLPTYINDIYTWLLPAASLIAVVMMMLGGLQYVMSRGKSKYIEKAKKRITNAITGLVILLSIFVLLNLIDPRLTALNALRIPMIKEVTILDAESSCERLTDADVGYSVALKTGTAACGGTGTISGTPVEGTIGSWKEDDVCNYTKCSGADAGKVCVKDGETSVCKSCAQLPSPTASSCNALDDTASGGTTYCVFNSTLNSCATAGDSLASARGISCPSILFDATQDGDTAGVPRGCGVYEDLDMAYSAQQIGDVADPVYMQLPINFSGGALLLQTICNADPCGVAAALGASRCAYNEGAASDTSRTVAEALKDFFGLSTSLGAGYFCHTF
ncbi:MAG: pilin [Patescibacteria group bacterium]